MYTKPVRAILARAFGVSLACFEMASRDEEAASVGGLFL
jgi:hypothetical protein